MGFPFGFLVGLILGAIVGFVVVRGTPVLFKRKGPARKSRAQKLFDLAKHEENQQRKRELLREIVDRYPRSEWADKALDERVKNGIMKAGQGSARAREKKLPPGFWSVKNIENDFWKEAQRLRDEGLSVRAVAERLGVPKSTVLDHTVRPAR
jgi:hypothetical protein